MNSFRKVCPHLQIRWRVLTTSLGFPPMDVGATRARIALHCHCALRLCITSKGKFLEECGENNKFINILLSVKTGYLLPSSKKKKCIYQFLWLACKKGDLFFFFYRKAGLFPGRSGFEQKCCARLHY